MASFVTRSGGELPDRPGDHFADDGGSVHEAAIDKAARAGLVAGAADGRFLPGVAGPTGSDGVVPRSRPGSPRHRRPHPTPTGQRLSVRRCDAQRADRRHGRMIHSPRLVGGVGYGSNQLLQPLAAARSPNTKVQGAGRSTASPRRLLTRRGEEQLRRHRRNRRRAALRGPGRPRPQPCVATQSGRCGTERSFPCLRSPQGRR